MLEVCLLALAGVVSACVGTSGALSLIRNYLATIQTSIPNLARIRLNSVSLLFSFGVALPAALICGLLPAFSATSIDLSTGLRERGTQLSGSRRVRRLLNSLISIEAGVCMLLLLTSGLLVRSLVRLMSDDHGLRPDHVLTLRIPTGSWQRVFKLDEADRQRRIQQYLFVTRQAEATHGVQATALSSSLPLSHTDVLTRLYDPLRTSSTTAEEILPLTQAVTRDYFRLMGIPVLFGRTFEARDAVSKLPVALVNKAFVHRFFSGQDPLGTTLNGPEGEKRAEIIGVVKHSPHLDFAQPIEPEIYRDVEQTLVVPLLTGLVARTHDQQVDRFFAL